MSLTLLTYEQVLKELGKSRSHLLLGNGFSIACEPCFAYGSLFEYAKAHGLPTSCLPIFRRLGTNNFEGVMRLLEDADWVAQHYGLIGGTTQSVMLSDLEAIKKALVDAIAKTHPDHTHDIPEAKKDTCVTFLEPYHNIFCTNYDLLLYWVEMHGHEKLAGRDGFDYDIDDPEAPYVVFSEHVGGEKGIFFIHGALHLYTVGGQVRKHSWVRTGKHLIQGIREALDAGQYPLFVAEGTAEKKLTQIQNSGYLSYCLGKLERIENSLVTFGLSFGENDQHIANVIAHNRKLQTIYIGLFGHPESPANLDTRKHVATLVEKRMSLIEAKRVRKELEVKYYDVSTAVVWDAPDESADMVEF